MVDRLIDTLMGLFGVAVTIQVGVMVWREAPYLWAFPVGLGLIVLRAAMAFFGKSSR